MKKEEYLCDKCGEPIPPTELQHVRVEIWDYRKADKGKIPCIAKEFDFCPDCLRKQALIGFQVEPN